MDQSSRSRPNVSAGAGETLRQSIQAPAQNLRRECSAIEKPEKAALGGTERRQRQTPVWLLTKLAEPAMRTGPESAAGLYLAAHCLLRPAERPRCYGKAERAPGCGPSLALGAACPDSLAGGGLSVPCLKQVRDVATRAVG